MIEVSLISGPCDSFQTNSPVCLSPGWWRSGSGSLVPLPGPEEGRHLPSEEHTHTYTQTQVFVSTMSFVFHSGGSLDHNRTWEYLRTHLHKWPQFFELLKDVEGHRVQAGLPPHCVLSWHTGRMRFLVWDRSAINMKHFLDNWGLKSSCELAWELYLKELTGSLSKVADDAFKGLTLRLIGDCIQIYCTCREKKGARVRFIQREEG